MSDLENDLVPQEEENDDPSTCNCAENATVRRHCFNYKECKTEWDGPAHFIEQWTKCPYHRGAHMHLDSPNVHLCAVCDTKYEIKIKRCGPFAEGAKLVPKQPK